MIDSEKTIERKLNGTIKKLGGWSIKLLATHVTGLPDRICLLPGGVVFFAEIKTTKMKPKPIQLLVHDKIRKLGFEVYVIDKLEQIEQIIENYVEI